MYSFHKFLDQKNKKLKSIKVSFLELSFNHSFVRLDQFFINKFHLSPTHAAYFAQVISIVVDLGRGQDIKGDLFHEQLNSSDILPVDALFQRRLSFLVLKLKVCVVFQQHGNQSMHHLFVLISSYVVVFSFP